MRNKKGQFFALYLVLLTLFMCGIVIAIYHIQEKNADSYLVSPERVLRLKVNASIFEMRERALIWSAAEDVGWSNSDAIKKKFFELLGVDGGEGEKMREFIFKDFVYSGQSKEEWVEILKDSDSQVNFLKAEEIYEFDLDSGGNILKVGRKELGKKFRLEAVNRVKINFVADVNYVYDGDYEIDKSIPSGKSLPKSTSRKRLIFIPINWQASEEDFMKKTKAAFDYYIGLEKLRGRGESYSPEYKFSNFNIDNWDDLSKIVEEVENHVISLGISYDKSKEIILAFSEGLVDGSQGFVHPPHNQVAFISSDRGVLSHELGHSLFGYCEEYTYFDIECSDEVEHKELVGKIIQNNVELVTNLLLGAVYEDLSDEELEEKIGVTFEKLVISQEYKDQYLDTDEGVSDMEDNLLDGFVECETEGWLRQHYEGKYLFKHVKGKYPRIFDGCQNSYPTCCIDSPGYLGDDNIYGINCVPWIKDRAELSSDDLCLGSFCGEDCRSIMGAYIPEKELRGGIRRYPV